MADPCNFGRVPNPPDLIARLAQPAVTENQQANRRDESCSTTDLDSTSKITKQNTEGGSNSASKKVSVMEIFKNLRKANPKTAQKRKEEPASPLIDETDTSEDDVMIVLSNETPGELPAEEQMKNSKKTGLSAKDILTGFRKAQNTRPNGAELLDESPVVIIESSFPSEKARRTFSPREILARPKSHSPEDVIDLSNSDVETPTNRQKMKKKRKSRPEESTESFIVTVRYRPQRKRFAELEQKMKCSATRSVSARDLLRTFGKKNEEKQNFISEPSSARAGTFENPETIDDDISHTADTHALREMSFREILSDKSSKPKNLISKLKELNLPVITHECLHVIYKAPPIEYRTISLPQRATKVLPEIDYSEPFNTTEVQPQERKFIYEVEEEERSSLAADRVRALNRDKRFERFRGMLYENLHSNDMWCDFFKPNHPTDILQDPATIRSMSIWLQNSYQILKKRTKRHNFRKKKSPSGFDDLGDFIINDFDEELTDDEEYTPLAIITGPSGVGKTSSVYTLVEETGGYVYEINASQARGKKDIFVNVSELSTTQLVHQNQETVQENEFQKGVILFEDVDILFESDKGFWSVIENALAISRRPIILTCSDISVIPENILECAQKENTIFELLTPSVDILCDYLYVTALTMGFNVSDQILRDLAEEFDCDLRRCILNLQLVCEIDNHAADVVNRISYACGKRSKLVDMNSLKNFSMMRDIYSVSDVIREMTFSSIAHEPMLLDVVTNNPILMEDDLRGTRLPYELNIADALASQLPDFSINPRKSLNIDNIREYDKMYFGSKRKGTRMTRRAISNMHNFTLEFDAGGGSVFETLPASKYIVDVSPILREMARYDEQIIISNKELDDEDDEHPKRISRRYASQKLLTNFQLPPGRILESVKSWNRER